MLDGIVIGVAFLLSLKAEYKMGRMRSYGMIGNVVFLFSFLKCIIGLRD